MFNLETDLLENTEELKTFLQGNYEKIDLLPGIDDTVTLTDAASVLGIATDTFIKFVVENNVKITQNRVKKSDLIDVILRNFLCNGNVFLTQKSPKSPKKNH